MKKILFLIFVLSFSITGCKKVLDVNPVAYIPADLAIKDKAGVQHALIGSYNALQSVGTYSRNMIVVGDLAADNLKATGTMPEYYQIDAVPIPAENGSVEGMWAAAYDGINRVNYLLYKLPSIGDMTPVEKDASEGEALFLRALFHYNLSVYFGGIPFKTQPTLDLSSIDVARNTLAQVYDQIITDLNTAKAKLPQTKVVKVTGRANTYSVSALLAKVYLSKFQLLGDAASAPLAISEAGRVITEGGYSLPASFGSLFNPKTNSAESIFEVVYDAQNFNRLAQFFYPGDLSGRYEFAPTADLIQSFEPGDSARLRATIGYNSQKKPFGIKYNEVASGADRVYVFRLAEMYLIRAEALAYSNGSVADIKSDINMIRKRAGLVNTTADNIPALKLAIENECRHEFAFEGHRWFDLVRTKRAIEVLGITNPDYTLFPIPLSELQTNQLMQKNPGY